MPAYAGCFELLASDSETGSGSGLNAEFPPNIVGYSIEFTVMDPGNAGIDKYMVIVYDFSAGGQVVGTRPTDGRQFVPDSYDYVLDENWAGVLLTYADGHTSAYILTPGKDITEGTYENGVSFLSGDEFHSGGDYKVLSQGDATPAGDGPGPNSCRRAYDNSCDEPTLCDPGTDTADCDAEDAPPTQDDRLTIYLTYPSAVGNVCVQLDGAAAGCMSQYYTTGAPECGSPTGTAHITTNVTPGTHSISAQDDGGNSWPLSTFTKADGCVRFKLH